MVGLKLNHVSKRGSCGLSLTLLVKWVSGVSNKRDKTIMTVHSVNYELPVSFVSNKNLNSRVNEKGECGVSIRVLNSLRPCDTNLFRWAGSSLIQLMVRRLFGAKQFPEPMHTVRLLGKYSDNFYMKMKYFIRKNAFQYVICKMTAIMVQP